MRVAYGPDRKRFKREDSDGTAASTTHYVGGKAFERQFSGANITDKHYIGDFAVVTYTGVGQNAVPETNYLHRDHLGSVEVISKADGTILERLSFDSWGRRRQGDWQKMTDAAIHSFGTPVTNRGYTGHEQLDSVGLVHMNGRVYDPTIGRFLSADPHVQAPGNLQNWNRYSYVLNNPLSYTDPTGFFFSKIWKSLGKAFGKLFNSIASAFKVALRNGILRSVIQIIGCAAATFVAGPLGGAAVCGFIAGAVTMAFGGTITEALQAMAFSYATMGAFAGASLVISELAKTVITGLQLVGNAAWMATTAIKAGIHGVVGGALSVARGGNFMQGFISSAAGAIGGRFAGDSGHFGEYGDRDFGNMVARAVVSGAAGCAGAHYSGGKCVNGATSAAMASLFNGDGPKGGHGRTPPGIGHNKLPIFVRPPHPLVLAIIIAQFIFQPVAVLQIDPGGPIALGLGENLSQFSKDVGGADHTVWSHGYGTFEEAFTSEVLFTDRTVAFNLTGIDNPLLAVQRAMTGHPNASVTDWELFQVYSNASLSARTTFYNNGKTVPSPFK